MLQIYLTLKKNVTVNKRRVKSHQDAKNCFICGKIILQNLAKNENYQNVRDHCHVDIYSHYRGRYRDATNGICNLKFNISNKIHVVFHNSSNYDYHFIITELSNESEGKFECLGVNTEKYKKFFVLIEKEVTKINKDGN